MRKLVLAGGLTAAIAIATGLVLLGGAYAGSSEQASARGSGKPKLCCWAVVSRSGVLLRGSGIDHVQEVGGGYNVVFTKPVAACAYSATIGEANLGSEEPVAGFINVDSLDGVSKGVFVTTSDINGGGAERGFHLVVTC